jgi:putative transposase
VSDRTSSDTLFPHKNIRRPAAHYVGRREYFVTFCCCGRRAVFAEPEKALWLIDELRRHSVRHRFAVYAYCVMPEHFHALVRGLGPGSDLLVFLKGFKQETAHEFRRKFHGVLWQKKFYDHILRRDDSAERVAAYIWANPVRKGICGDALEYPFCGSFVLDWKKLISAVEVWEPSWEAKRAGAKNDGNTNTNTNTNNDVNSNVKGARLKAAATEAKTNSKAG